MFTPHFVFGRLSKNVDVLACALFSIISVSGQLCVLPPIYRKTLYSIENGKETTTQIKATEISQDIDKLNGTCYQILRTTTVEANKTDSVHVIYKNRTNDCYFCYELIARSENVIQYRKSKKFGF